jgi:hypothetical protein
MIDVAELEPRCDQCRKHVEPEDLETVLRYYCRDCAAAHDLDVPLCKAATESILAELKTRDPLALMLLLFNMSKEEHGPVARGTQAWHVRGKSVELGPAAAEPHPMAGSEVNQYDEQPAAPEPETPETGVRTARN